MLQKFIRTPDHIRPFAELSLVSQCVIDRYIYVDCMQRLQALAQQERLEPLPSPKMIAALREQYAIDLQTSDKLDVIARWDVLAIMRLAETWQKRCPPEVDTEKSQALLAMLEFADVPLTPDTKGQER